MIVATAVACLAINLYHEARGETVLGRYAVALTTMNRAKQDPEKVCEVTFKPHQFSWTSKVVKTSAGWKIPHSMKPRDATAWWYANRIAAASLAGRMPDFTGGADHYHAAYVRPAWAGKMTMTKRIGLHLFYVRRSK